MRGLWDNEQTLSPSLLNSAVALLGGFMAALAAINVIVGLFALFGGRFGSAFTLFSGGVGLPFAVWLGLRMLADIVVVQNRTLDRIASLGGQEGPQVARFGVNTSASSTVSRASDDGPVYPAEG